MLASLVAWIRRHEVVSFFVLAYAITFLAFGAYIVFPGLPYGPFWLVGIFSPTLAALTIAFVVGGPAGVGRLLDGFRRWRVGGRWYLAAAVFVLGPLALALTWTVLGGSPTGPAAGLTLPVVLGHLAFTLTSGPLAEEAGWRGFALPRLQQRHGALTASVAVGLLWAFWHVPQYVVAPATMIPFPIFVPQVVALSILFAWLYNNTGGSLVITVLAHFCFNFTGAWVAGVLGLLPPMILYVGGGIMVAAWTVLVVVYAGPRYLSRRRRDEQPIPGSGSALPTRI